MGIAAVRIGRFVNIYAFVVAMICAAVRVRMVARLDDVDEGRAVPIVRILELQRYRGQAVLAHFVRDVCFVVHGYAINFARDRVRIAVIATVPIATVHANRSLAKVTVSAASEDVRDYARA